MFCGKWFGRSLVACATLAILPLAGADDNTTHINMDSGLMGFTVPSRVTKQSFMEPGVVKEWRVKPDDVVKKGQLLGREDTDIEELKLRSKRIQADSTAAVEAATADRDEKKIEYDSKLKAFSLQATSADEVQEAKLDYEQKEALLRNADVQREMYLADVDIQARIIDKMQLISPVDGIIKEINIQEGEVVDPNKPEGAITIVTNDPLWVEVKVPSAQALKLKTGDTAQVAYQDDPNTWLPAKVIYLDPEVEAGSGTEKIRLELPNSSNTVSGRWMNVKLPGDSPAQ